MGNIKLVSWAYHTIPSNQPVYSLSLHREHIVLPLTHTASKSLPKTSSSLQLDSRLGRLLLKAEWYTTGWGGLTRLLFTLRLHSGCADVIYTSNLERTFLFQLVPSKFDLYTKTNVLDDLYRRKSVHIHARAHMYMHIIMRMVSRRTSA